MSDAERTRLLVIREDAAGLYVRPRAGVLRFRPWGATKVHPGDKVRVTFNYPPEDAGRYDPIPAARCWHGRYYLGEFSWEAATP